MAEDPYEVGRGVSRAFWADSVADDIEARDPDEPIVIKGGVSPSGVAHLGNFNEIMRGYFVAEVLRERGHEVRQVFTSDDKDPLRTLPRKLADLRERRRPRRSRRRRTRAEPREAVHGYSGPIRLL